MKKLFAALAMLLSAASISAQTIVPTPARMEKGEGRGTWTAKMKLCPTEESLSGVATLFCGKQCGYEISLCKSAEKANIILSIDPNLQEEAYRLEIASGKVGIKGGSPRGVLWALQSLKQIMAQNPCPGKEEIVCDLLVEDCPASGRRVCTLRGGEIETLLEIAAEHKFNILKTNPIELSPRRQKALSAYGISIEQAEAKGNLRDAIPALAAEAESAWSGKSLSDSTLHEHMSQALLPLYRLSGQDFNADSFVLCDTIPPRGDHYPFRRAFEAITPISHCSIVLFGDSLTERGDWGGFFPGKPMVNRGLGGDRLCGFESRVDHIAKAKPRMVLILGGVNDMLFTTITYEKMLQQLERILDCIARESPRTTVCIQSALPVLEEMNPQFCTGANAKILRYNSLLKELCVRRGLRYIDIWSEMQIDGALPRERTVDGIHLSAAGYAVWIDVLKKEKLF